MERDRWGDAPRHMSRGPPTPLLQYLLYLLRDRTGRLRFEKAKAHSDDIMNNLADALANEGHVSSRTFNIGSITVPTGWVDTAPVLCHQPLDYLTKLTVHTRVRAPAKSITFKSFSDRWMVMIGNMFGIILDPGNYIGKVWDLSVPEGLKEVLWKEMNGVQVLGHRYFGTGSAKSDMGRYCLCRSKMSLGHILLGCEAYKLQPLLATLLETLTDISPASSFKTLTPDTWGISPWYLLLALKELEESAFLIVKGRKSMLKKLKKTRQKRVWVIGNYYWALWKWRMKEIHDAKFTFVPWMCADSLWDILRTPVPPHMLKGTIEDEESDKPSAPSTGVRLPDASGSSGHVSFTCPPAPGAHLSAKGKSILHAIRAPVDVHRSHLPTRQEVILHSHRQHVRIVWPAITGFYHPTSEQ